jgi:hypothetical protein
LVAYMTADSFNLKELIMNEADKRRHDVITRQAGKPGLRGKVNAKCVECIFDPIGGGGNWRQQVEACTSVTCPLFLIRPTSAGEA